MSRGGRKKRKYLWACFHADTKGKPGFFLWSTPEHPNAFPLRRPCPPCTPTSGVAWAQEPLLSAAGWLITLTCGVCNKSQNTAVPQILSTGGPKFVKKGGKVVSFSV